jgi:osmotically-inducible protein OsmY
MNDKDIRKRVMEELEYEPSIEAANIGVVVHAGVVTLSGHVPSY